MLMVACQAPTPTAVASPSPSPSPHTAPTDAILQSAEIPAGLNPCLGSGPIDVYVTTLAHADANLGARVGGQWEQLRTAGAISGAISLFTSTPAACIAELATTSSAKSVVAFVAEFSDAGQADRAWEAGVFGFMPPSPGELPAGVTRGSGTGLRPSSWAYDRPPVRLGWWQKSARLAVRVATKLHA